MRRYRSIAHLSSARLPAGALRPSGEMQPGPVVLDAEGEAHAGEKASHLGRDGDGNGGRAGCRQRRALDAHAHQEGELSAAVERPHAHRGAAVVAPPHEEAAATLCQASGEICGRDDRPAAADSQDRRRAGEVRRRGGPRGEDRAKIQRPRGEVARNQRRLPGKLIGVRTRRRQAAEAHRQHPGAEGRTESAAGRDADQREAPIAGGRPVGAPATIVPPAAARPVVSMRGTATVRPSIAKTTGTVTVRSPLCVNVAEKKVGRANVPDTPAATKLRGGTLARSSCAWFAATSQWMVSWSAAAGAATVAATPVAGATISTGSRTQVLGGIGMIWAAAPRAASSRTSKPGARIDHPL